MMNHVAWRLMGGGFALGVLLAGGATMPPAQAADGDVIIYYDTLENGVLTGGKLRIPRKEAPERFLLNAELIADGWPVTTVMDSGPVSNRIDLVVVGDGYTADELAQYAIDTDGTIDEFFDEPPFDTYASYFNVHRVDVVSNESGVDELDVGIYRDTALDMAFGCYSTPRLLCIDVTKATQAGMSAPASEYVLALANSTRYGGAGYDGVATMAARNEARGELALHEVGHAFGGLADEYGGGGIYYGGELSEPNVSIYNAPAQVSGQQKWYRWIGEGNVSTYEGARYYEQGIYRPTPNSKMRMLGYPFDAVNVEQLVLRMYERLNVVDGVTPIASEPLLANHEFYVVPLEPIGHALTVQWSLDGEPVAGATGTTFSVDLATLEPGDHEVSVVVVDETTLVRDEGARDAYMTFTRSWPITSGTSSVDFDADFYACGDPMGISLDDADLAGAGSQSVEVTTLGGDLETVSLIETGSGSGVFAGSLTTAAGAALPGDGVVQLVDDEPITVAYDDADYGNGEPGLAVDTAYADCPANPSAYQAEVIAAHLPDRVLADHDVVVSVTYRNVGTATWDTSTFLATSDVRGRASDFYHPSAWFDDATPCGPAHGPVASGDTGTFTFVAHTPATVGPYAEPFELNQVGIGWFEGLGDNLLWEPDVVDPAVSVLTNGGFEGAFVWHWGGVLPEGWAGTWRPPFVDGPVWGDVDLGGERGHVVLLNNIHGDFEIGVRQTVGGLTPGEPFVFSADAYPLGAGTTAWLAVDPDGGTDLPSREHPFANVPDQWSTRQVTGTVGPSGAVTVFLWAWNEAGMADVYVDNARLEVGGVLPDAPTLLAAASLKQHGSVGELAVDAIHPRIGQDAAIECRDAGPTTLELTFDQNLVPDGTLEPADVAVSVGSVDAVSLADHRLTVHLSGVPDGTPVTLTFPGLTGVDGQAVTAALCLAGLQGDVTGDGQVDVFDLLDVRNTLTQWAGIHGRADLTTDGVIDIFDLLGVRNRLQQTAGDCP